MNVQYTGENQPMRAKESWNRNLIQLSEQSLELISIFKEAYLFFFKHGSQKNFNTIRAWTIVQALKNNNLVAQSL